MLLQIESFVPHSDWECFTVEVEKKKTRYDYALIFQGLYDKKQFEKIESLCGRFHTNISIESSQGVCVR